MYALYRDEEAAAAAVHNLIDADFATEQIGVVMRRGGEAELVPVEHKTGIQPGALLGGALGIAAGALALPATGVIALGGAVAALGGAAVGGAAGTLTGALGGLGVWKDEPAVTEADAADGGVLVGALTAPERVQQARAALEAAGAKHVARATQAEVERAVQAGAARPSSALSPDQMAKRAFYLTLAYVFAFVTVVWLFIIRPG